MHVDIIDKWESLAGLRPQWDAVYARDPEAHIFLSWTWIAGWFRRLGHDWVVLAAKPSKDSTEYVGFFPLQLHAKRISSGGFRNELDAGGGYFTGYNGFLCVPDFQDDVLRAFGEHAQKLNWAKCHLNNFFVSPERMERFLSAFPTSTFSFGKVQRPDDGDGIDHDIYVYVPLPDDWESFLNERLGSKTRWTARRALKDVDGGGEFHVSHVTAETLERDLQILLKFWEMQWAGKLAARYNPGLPKAMMNTYRRMFTACFQDGLLFLPVLWKGETPIGAVASLIDTKTRSLVAQIVGRDPAVKKPGPGFTLHMYGMRWAIQNGYTSYDLQTGDFSYKYGLGGLERRIECHVLKTKDGANLRGKLDPRTLSRVLQFARERHKADRADDAERICHEVLLADPDHKGAQDLLDQIQATRAARNPQRSVGQGIAAASGVKVEYTVRFDGIRGPTAK